ncbi:type IV secretion protein Rhs [Stenotrophomonas rhizophila]|nr:type IV secretion protein Rhs [Stenotrophomonas rhizophila]
MIAALLAALRMGDGHRFLRLHTVLGDGVLVAETLQGAEQIDGVGFTWSVTTLSLDAGIALEPLIGQPALLQMQLDDGSLRPFHGRITSAERIGGNGGLARYRLRLQPWMAFLGQRVDSYVFHDASVVDIVENVFADYVGLLPAWRWDLDRSSLYLKRTLTTQYQETDLTFVQRLLAEEGIYYWFEHSGEPDSPSFGKHMLVLADHQHGARDLGPVRFHRADASERADSVQQWSLHHRWCISRVTRTTWDSRTLQLRQASAQARTSQPDLGEDIDTCGPDGWPDHDSGQRRAQQHLDALRVRAHTVAGRGRWRQLAAGAQFQLTQHCMTGEDTDFLCLSVQHLARNNFEAEVLDALERRLGPATQVPLPLPASLGGLAIRANLPALSTAFYDNCFVAIPAAVVYRPQTEDGDGVRLHPRALITGTLSAIVVSDGEPLLSDRDHRIKVQFPWQRGSQSSTGLAHPGGDDNAPADGGAWTWVRVMTPWGGDNWGGVFLPRRGQEVLVAFFEGDIDSPVVVGAVYNGRGQTDAAHNRVATGGAHATGNAPAWFDGNEHPAVYTGFKSQALADSQDGLGGYQQLRLDDTPGQGRAQLSTTQHATTLTLGHLKEGQDNLRGADRGFGAELSTQASGALRAGQGLLLSTEPGESQLAASQALAQLEQSAVLVQGLNESAVNQQAQLPNESAQLPAQQSLERLQRSLRATQSGTVPDSITGGDGEAPGWDKPVLMGSGVAGVMSLTPADQVWVSGTHTTLAAGVALNWLSEGALTIAVREGLTLYTEGSKPKSGSPNQEQGIALHAANGKVSARAHCSQAVLAARTNVKIASTQADVTLSAPNKHLLLTAAGAYIRIEGDNIELSAPGTLEMRGTQREWTEPEEAPYDVDYSNGQLGGCELKDNLE